MARVVNQTRAQTPCLWLIAGEIFQNDLSFTLNEGKAEIKLLATAKVDAVLLTPRWLRLGSHQAKSLIDLAPFRVLSANINDTANLPLAHPWLTKRFDKTTIAITGLLLDSGDVILKLKSVRYLSGEYAQRKTLTLLKEKSDFIGLLLAPGSSTSNPGFDFIFTPEEKGLVRYDLTFVNTQLNDVQKRLIPLENIEPEPNLLVVLDSLKKVQDSLASLPVITSRVKISPQTLTRTLIEGILKLREWDGFLYHSTRLIKETLPAGTVTLKQLFFALSEPERLIIVSLTGKTLKQLLPQPNLVLMMLKEKGKATALPVSPSALRDTRTYRIATTFSFIKSHPELTVNGLELSPKNLWEYTRDILQCQGKR